MYTGHDLDWCQTSGFSVYVLGGGGPYLRAGWYTGPTDRPTDRVNPTSQLDGGWLRLMLLLLLLWCLLSYSWLPVNYDHKDDKIYGYFMPKVWNWQRNFEILKFDGNSTTTTTNEWIRHSCKRAAWKWTDRRWGMENRVLAILLFNRASTTN